MALWNFDGNSPLVLVLYNGNDRVPSELFTMLSPPQKLQGKDGENTYMFGSTINSLIALS